MKIKLIFKLILDYVYALLLKNFPSRNTPDSFGCRLRIAYLRLFLKETGRSVNIQPGVHFEGLHNISIGDNSGIGRNSIVVATCPLSIGQNVMIGPELIVYTANHETSRERLMIESPMSGAPVVVGNDVWLGARVTLLAGSHVSDGAIVAAGAVVTGTVDPYTIVGGVPARKIGERY